MCPWAINRHPWAGYQMGLSRPSYTPNWPNQTVDENVNRAHLRTRGVAIKWCHQPLHSFLRSLKWMNTAQTQCGPSSGLITIRVMTLYILSIKLRVLHYEMYQTCPTLGAVAIDTLKTWFWFFSNRQMYSFLDKILAREGTASTSPAVMSLVYRMWLFTEVSHQNQLT